MIQVRGNEQEASIKGLDSNRFKAFRSALGSPWWNGKDGDDADGEEEAEVDPPKLVLKKIDKPR